jgi:hypothetical protein
VSGELRSLAAIVVLDQKRKREYKIYTVFHSAYIIALRAVTSPQGGASWCSGRSRFFFCAVGGVQPQSKCLASGYQYKFPCPFINNGRRATQALSPNARKLGATLIPFSAHWHEDMARVYRYHQSQSVYMINRSMVCFIHSEIMPNERKASRVLEVLSAVANKI